MEKILLVEPNYKNKYPPIGLMKISSYFKGKGDYVEFHKGLLTKSQVKSFDKVFVTTLFTFDIDLCIQTIKYYISIIGNNKVFVGGIASTILPEKFIDEIPGINLLKGQLTSSNILGYDDDINIDILDLDYDMLWDINYEYPAADSYFIYTSRGCPRKCTFCAVKSLEPNFYDCENVLQQIKNVDLNYGIKKNLLVMDNNILFSSKFDNTIDVFKQLGFEVNNNKTKKNNDMKYYLISLRKRISEGRKYNNLLDRIKNILKNLKYSRINKDDKMILESLICDINNENAEECVKLLLNNEQFLVDFFDRYNYHKISRYVDFNQGLDARLFSEDKAKKMSQIALKPCRIAFDDLRNSDEYFSAMERAVNNGIRSFSNYLLYNYNEKPESLWKRLHMNVLFCKRHQNKHISFFSFPMKYASIEHTDRNYVGEFWHKKYLRAMNVILNVTGGVVAKEEDFFYRAFGKTEEEFLEILAMPDEFIRYRDFFQERKLTSLWKSKYKKLTDIEREKLINILDRIVEEPELLSKKYETGINEILTLYTFKKKNVESNKAYYENYVNKEMGNTIM